MQSDQKCYKYPIINKMGVINVVDNVDIENKHHILVDGIAFEKFRTFKKLISYKTNKRVNSSILLDALVTIAVQNFEEDENKVLEVIEKSFEKRGKKLKEKEKLNINEMLEKLKQ